MNSKKSPPEWRPGSLQGCIEEGLQWPVSCFSNPTFSVGLLPESGGAQKRTIYHLPCAPCASRNVVTVVLFEVAVVLSAIAGTAICANL